MYSQYPKVDLYSTSKLDFYSTLNSTYSQYLELEVRVGSVVVVGLLSLGVKSSCGHEDLFDLVANLG